MELAICSVEPAFMCGDVQMEITFRIDMRHTGSITRTLFPAMLSGFLQSEINSAMFADDLGAQPRAPIKLF